MLQMLAAGLTVAFVGYVVYEVFKTVSQSGSQTPAAPLSPTEATPKPKAAEAEPEKLAAADEPKATEEKATQLCNPATGETCPVPTNYRFAKKWVKEALVQEGLLEKVYKAAELDDAVSHKVKEALERLKSLEKYQA